MDDLTITRILTRKRNNIHFNGVFGSDEISNIEVKYFPSCYIFNEGKFETGKGTHWVAVYIDEDGSLDYYDSYGKKPLIPEIKSFVKGYKMRFNDVQVQSYDSSVCGQHCIFFLVKRSKGHSIDSIVKTYFIDGNPLKHLSIISRSYNDNYVKRWVDHNML